MHNKLETIVLNACKTNSETSEGQSIKGKMYSVC